MSNLNFYLKRVKNNSLYLEEQGKQTYAMHINIREWANSDDIDDIRAIASELDDYGLTWDESQDVVFGTKAAFKSYYDSEKKAHEKHVEFFKKYRESDEYKQKKAAEDEHLNKQGLNWMVKQKEERINSQDKFELGDTFEDFFADAKPYKG